MGCMSEVELTWKTPPHTLTLHKTHTGSLGITVRTFPRVTEAGLSSVTIVYRISPKCTVQDHSVLDVNDRIVSIDGKPITRKTKEEVYAILKAHSQPYISLGLCRALKSPINNTSSILKETNFPLNLNVVDKDRVDPPLNLKRLLSGVSADSGNCSAPTTGDANGSFVFENTNNNNSVPVLCKSSLTPTLYNITQSLSPNSGDSCVENKPPAIERQYDTQIIRETKESNILRSSPDHFSAQFADDRQEFQTIRSLSGNSAGSQHSYLRQTLAQNSHDLRRNNVQRTYSQSSGDSLTIQVCLGNRLSSCSNSSSSDNSSGKCCVFRSCSTCKADLTHEAVLNKGSLGVASDLPDTPHPDRRADCFHNPHTVCVQADRVFSHISCENPYLSDRVNSLPAESLPGPHLYNDSQCRTQSLPLTCDPSDFVTNNCMCYSVGRSAFTDMAFVSLDSEKLVSTATRCTSKTNCSECLTVAQQILKYPQNVRWDPNTKVITLNRDNNKNPLGVSFTHPFCKNKDGTVDAYTLVERIDKGGAAEGKLFLGDWIRSVNGKPLHKASEALSVTSLLEESERVRFVIQRPVGMKRALGDLKVSPDKSSKHYNYSPSVSPECWENFSADHPLNINVDKSEAVNNRQTSTKHKRIERYMSSSSQGSNNSGQCRSTNSPRSCSFANCDSNNLQQSVSSMGNCIDIFSLARTRSAMEDTVKFPSMKLFVLGSHAIRMTELLIPKCSQQLAAQSKEKFLHLSCFVREDLDGVTKLYLHEGKSVCENELCGVWPQGSEGNQTGICEEDIEFDIATQSGSEHLPRCFSRMTSRTQNFQTVTVNLDIFIFTEEKFFSQCARLLFSKNSLFFVTFDGGKVLENTTEMSRIGRLVHEIRTNAGVESPLYLYGFLDTDGSDAVSTCSKTDELKALFYTDHGRQILRYTNVAMPHFVTQTGTSLGNVCQIARQLIGRIVIQQEFLTGQLHLATLAAMAWIQQLRRQGCQLINMSDLREGINSLISDVQPEKTVMIIRELHSAGTILLADVCFDFDQMTSNNEAIHIQPICAVQCLQSFLCELEKPGSRNSARETTGVGHPTSRTKLMLQKAFKALNCSQLRFENFFELLWKFKIVFNMWNSQDDYWLTYFLPESHTFDNIEMTEEHLLYVRLDRFVSGAVFLACVNKLAEVCKAVRISGLSINTAEIYLRDWKLWIEHLWTEDLIKLSLRSEKSNISSSAPFGFMENLNDAMKSCLPYDLAYQVCVPCPLNEECQVIRERQPHLIDIFRKEPNFCGNTRVDDFKAITIWQHGIQQKETVSKRAYGDKGSGGGPPSPNEKKKFDLSTPVLNLPFNLLNRLFLQLLLPMPMGNDWAGFAGCIGRTGNEVAIYGIQKNPAEEVIRDWARVNRSTLQDLIDVLSSQEMERLDLVDMIKDKIDIS